MQLETGLEQQLSTTPGRLVDWVLVICLTPAFGTQIITISWSCGAVLK
jgi:hypothetical protein